MNVNEKPPNNVQITDTNHADEKPSSFEVDNIQTQEITPEPLPIFAKYKEEPEDSKNKNNKI